MNSGNILNQEVLSNISNALPSMEIERGKMHSSYCNSIFQSSPFLSLRIVP